MKKEKLARANQLGVSAGVAIIKEFK